MSVKVRVLLVLVVAMAVSGVIMGVAEVSVNAYGGGLSGDHVWTSRGGPFTIFESHPAWPEHGIEAGWRINPLGTLLSVGFWFVSFGVIVLVWTASRRRPDEA